MKDKDLPEVGIAQRININVHEYRTMKKVVEAARRIFLSSYNQATEEFNNVIFCEECINLAKALDELEDK